MTRTLTDEARKKMSDGAKNRVITEETRQLLCGRTHIKGSNFARWAWIANACAQLGTGYAVQRVPSGLLKLHQGKEIVKTFRRINDLLQYLELEAGIRGIKLSPQPPATKASQRLVTPRPPRDATRGYVQVEVLESTREIIRAKAKAAGMPMLRYLEWAFEGDHSSDIEEGITR
jgi:hypothetical protein